MRRFKEKSNNQAFTLPTVLIASIVMLTVLASVGIYVSATVSALSSEYYNQIARDAAEAGVLHAKECLEKGQQWTKPLRTGGDCSGLDQPCTQSNCYLVSSSGLRASYYVDPLSTGGSTGSVNSKGVIERLRVSNQAVWSTYSRDYKLYFTSDTPVAWSKLSLGSSFSCGLTAEGDIYCWGNNTNGQLGAGGYTNTSTPRKIAQGEVPSGVKFKDVEASNMTACALATNDRVYCWGNSNTGGQLGNGSVSTISYSPVQVSLASSLRITDIAVGTYHACAVATTSRAYCWGSGSYGQLGRGSTIDSATPVLVSKGSMPSVNVSSIVAGDTHTCAIGSDNKTYCWGRGSSGQLGRGSTTNSTTPVPVSRGAMPASMTVQSIISGGGHSCAIASNGQAYCWGAGANGQLGRGSTADSTTPVSISKGAMPNLSIKELFGGSTHTCSIASNDKVYCWGHGGSGRLGNGSTTNRTTPALVSPGDSPTDASFESGGAGPLHTCAITTEGEAFCWGSNTNGRLGDGSSTTLPGNKLTPVRVKDAEPVDDKVYIYIS